MSASEGGGITPKGLQRQLRRLERMEMVASRQAEALGHDLGPFELEARWYATVATCKRCRLIAAVDLTESPYLFGRALKRKCK